MNSFPEIASVPAIAAIVYTVIDIVKTAVGGSEKFNRFIPLTAAVLGALCGLVAFFVARRLSVRVTLSSPLYSALQAVCPQQEPTRQSNS